MKILFVPVSGKEGIGEYMRSMILAQALETKYPNADIRFALSKEAPYVKNCPYPTLLTERSPTYHSKEINRYIDDFKPDVVVFDASGRAKQIKHAKKTGALTIFIAQHDKKIRRGLKLNRLINTDFLLIAQPEFTMSKLSPWSLAKLRWLNKKLPVYLGCVFVPPTLQEEQEVLVKYNLRKGQYIFASAGSGGHFMSNGQLAAEGFNQALNSANLPMPFVQVWGANYQGDQFPSQDSKNINLTSVSNLEFICLLKNCHVAVINGGDTLLQGLSLKVPMVAVPVSSDQPQRIEKVLEHAHCFVGSSADVNAVLFGLNVLLNSDNLLSIKDKLREVSVNNGYEVFVDLLSIGDRKC